ncbi:hypothetical protein KP77_28480 [Jeotgalibacillus alimentarius]|uniref:Zinc-ribbon domain-containing protein n=1 Tax=Jeotgalibacillus alimentarius TaxID=135826 RepID=A0A0C2VQK5_9BACL|nr:zinc ribbon domain-containing protein [Jeotgalibacillus alimentarius]KIL46721.1 hypothetical protein KP77_28480 [Jeotgalibacillus alimentarius]
MTCSSCGHIANQGEKFCQNCGQTLEPKLETQPSQSPQPKTKKTFRHKLLISVLGVFVLLAASGIGGNYVISNQIDLNKKLKAMDRDFQNRNPEAFLSHFETEDIEHMNADHFYDYINQQDWSVIRDQLSNEIESLETNGFADPLIDREGNKILALVSGEGLWGLPIYEEVNFKLHPTEVFVLSSLSDVQFTVNKFDYSLKEDEWVSAGTYLPGSYSWKSLLTNEFGDISEEGELLVNGNGENRVQLELPVTAGMIELTSDVKEAELYINGEATGKKISELASFGPIAYNQSMVLSAMTKNDQGESVESEAITIESDTPVHLKFTHIQDQLAAEEKAELEEQAEKRKLEAIATVTEEQKTEVASFIRGFRDSYENALNYEDYSYISSYFKSGSVIEDEYQEYLASFDDTYFHFDFLDHSVETVEVLDQNKFKVITNESFDFYNHVDEIWRYYRLKEYIVVDQYGDYTIEVIDVLDDEIEEVTN